MCDDGGWVYRVMIWELWGGWIVGFDGRIIRRVVSGGLGADYEEGLDWVMM